MVVIYLKQSEERQLLYECSGSDSVERVTREVVAIHNLHLKVARLVEEGKQLLLYGPSKPHQDDDSDDGSDDLQKASTSSGTYYMKDPSGKRTGQACDPALADTLRKTLSDAEACISKDQVLHKVVLNITALKEVIQNVKGAVMICFPMGLPRYDPVQELLAGTYKDSEAMDPDTAQMWWAGKELMREKRLSDHVGKNEKTKIIVKLQVRGHAPPPREPPIDMETQKAMLAYHYKQQQEQKKLAEDENDSYTNSEWANPKALKSQFQGLSFIHYK